MSRYAGPYLWAWMERAWLRRTYVVTVALPYLAYALARGAVDGVQKWCGAMAEAWRGW